MNAYIPMYVLIHAYMGMHECMHLHAYVGLVLVHYEGSVFYLSN
jgi:hypothetical protein